MVSLSGKKHKPPEGAKSLFPDRPRLFIRHFPFIVYKL